jgi:hypothetical protein
MFRRSFCAALVMVAAVAARAEAVSVRDVIELSRAGLSEPVLLALIEVDRSVYSLDTATLKELKDAGVSDAVIVAMIRSGRERPAPAVEAAPAPAPVAQTAPPQVVVIEHQEEAPAPQPAPVPVYVPVPVPYPAARHVDRVTTTIQTDQGIVKARVPVPANCVKAEPVYWGFGGKLRPGSWEPPPTIVCR